MILTIWQNKGAIGVLSNSAWSLLAQAGTLPTPPGGQVTIYGLLVVAILYLRNEVKNERKEAQEARQESKAASKQTFDILTEYANTHKDGEDTLRNILVKNLEEDANK